MKTRKQKVNSEVNEKWRKNKYKYFVQHSCGYTIYVLVPYVTVAGTVSLSLKPRRFGELLWPASTFNNTISDRHTCYVH